MKELDMVVLEQDIKEHGLQRGDIGAIVHRYNNGLAFEVEFVTGEGHTVAVLTLKPDAIRLMKQREILHVRELMAA